MNKSLWVLLVWLIGQVCAPVASAHEFKINRAKLEFSPQQTDTAKVMLDIDVLELSQVLFQLPEEKQALVAAARALTTRQLEQLRASLFASMQSDGKLLVDGKRITLQQQRLNEAPWIQGLLQQPEATTNYRIRYTAVAPLPDSLTTLQMQFPALLGKVDLTISQTSQQIVDSGSVSASYQLSYGQSVVSVWGNYIYQGILHIIPLGLDHILFVLLLFLSTRHWRQLCWLVSAFAVAHSVTLSATVLGYIGFNIALIEVLIALSIVVLAIENQFFKLNIQWRFALTLVFGLLHGMGFASVLGELGLAENNLIASLIAFNIGIEIGQLLVVAVAWLLLFKLRDQSVYQYRLLPAMNGLIGLTALVWCVERI